jgi:hypothetical protein
MRTLKWEIISDREPKIKGDMKRKAKGIAAHGVALDSSFLLFPLF